MNQATFLVDGFNLYHSVRTAARILKASTKWLDIRRLCSSYLYLVHGLVGGKAELRNVYYFSALAVHLEASDPDVTARHRDYISCLEDTGIIFELSRFKFKDIRCPLKCPYESYLKKQDKFEDCETCEKEFYMCVFKRLWTNQV